MSSKYVYSFGNQVAEGNGSLRNLLGGKGAGLAEMTRIGLPVPAGLTITTEVCQWYYANGQQFPPTLRAEVLDQLSRLENLTGLVLGDPTNPLLVSVRSGAPVSMPGMMETILNLGLNDQSLEGLAHKTNRRFALDAYRRLILMFGTTAKGIPQEHFDTAFEAIKNETARPRLKLPPGRPVADTDLNEGELAEVVDRFKTIYKAHIGRDFPQRPDEQLWGAIEAVVGSWMSDKAITYRKVENLTNVAGTAVTIQQMVFGNKGENSGTGVCFTRDPNSGENLFYGDYLINAQGEDVVSGVRTPLRLAELERTAPQVYRQLVEVRATLERHFKDMQDLEFTVEEGRLFMLQCRTGQRSAQAAFRIAVEMVQQSLITKAEAVARIKPRDIERMFYPVIDPTEERELAKHYLATGIDAVPVAATGKVVFNAKDAVLLAERGERVILVRKETSPEDVAGMHAAQGILTATGGKTSHAAVVARGWGKSCVVGCDALVINYTEQEFSVGDHLVKRGESITLDGATGRVYLGHMKLVKPTPTDEFFKLLAWCDEFRRLGVRTNADTPADAAYARSLGAEGIGLCRTEHMFFETEERILAIQEMIVAENPKARRAALDRLRPFQKADFVGIFESMDGLPVTIRLIDPPLHEFVPHDKAKQKLLADKLGLPLEQVRQRVYQLHESNPMLGHRGCRLCITYPEILDMQVGAIMEAACEVQQRGIAVHPEIMHPLVIDKREFAILEARTRQVADAVLAKAGVTIAYRVGTMIEVPRAALLADELAELAEFFSFGTNDLTQMTLGMSRDDAGRFLPDYVDPKKAGILPVDPFQSLDQAGVGSLIRLAVEKGRQTRPQLKVGICGEHGGDPESVQFCAAQGFDYVSCSPFRVPIARLAAAQYAIATKTGRT